jgi:serine/threonine protein kinase
MKQGAIIDNRFRIVKSLGKGGQGMIYLVEDTINDNARRALKTLRKEILPKNLGRMRREVVALKGVKSEFVLSMEATNMDTYQLDSEEVPYFVTELAEYGTLSLFST